jgi:hypothetical protein
MPLAVEFQGNLELKTHQCDELLEGEVDYIDSIVYEGFDVVPSRAVAGYLNQFATGFTRLGATARETGVSLLGICERSSQKLVKCLSGNCSS